MIIKELTVGPIMANCFILGCENTKEAVVIDPGDEADKILLALAKDELTLKYILNTHGHFDHVGGNKQLKEATGSKLMIHSADEHLLDLLSLSASELGLSLENSPKPDSYLNDNDIISFGNNIELKVIHTPGHTLGGVSFYTDGVVFVGDTLFEGSIGRTDFPGGDYNTLISSIRNRLFILDNHTKVYVGHGPATYIEKEKRFNPFCKI